jgi:hypothetical protein
MDTGVLSFASYSREGMVYDMKRLLSYSPMPTKAESQEEDQQGSPEARSA